MINIVITASGAWSEAEGAEFYALTPEQLAAMDSGEHADSETNAAILAEAMSLTSVVKSRIPKIVTAKVANNLATSFPARVRAAREAEASA